MGLSFHRIKINGNFKLFYNKNFPASILQHLYSIIFNTLNLKPLTEIFKTSSVDSSVTVN